MIRIKNLSKSYKIDDLSFDALKNINLQIKQGEFVLILGQSGCGKSTLLNIMGGMDEPTYGQVEVAKEDLAKLRPDQLAKYRRNKVGMIFQKFNLINDATVLENVKMPLKFSGQSEKAQTKIVMEALEVVGLTDKASSLPKKLSGGQQQRVAIARALVNNPEILLCDEPTGNLDSKTGEEIIRLLKKLNEKGHTIIMVTHNEAYEKYADRVIRMLDGNIVNEETINKKVLSESNESPRGTKSISFLSELKLSISNIKRRKLRFFLTSFGIAIGAMAIVVLVSFGAGLQKEVNDQLQANSQVEEVSVTGEKINEVSFNVGTDFTKTEKKNLNDNTISQLEKVPNVEAVYTLSSLSGELKYNDKTAKLYLQGLTPLKYVKDKEKAKIKYGRFFSSDDENGLILPYGQAVALGFDDPEKAINKEVTITVQKKDFSSKIIGVLGKDEKFAYSTFAPDKIAQELLKETKAEELKKDDPDLYNSITARASNTGKVPDVKKTVESLGYGASSYDDIAKQMNRVFVIMQIVMGVIGGIALLVASLGIVNTMIMSVLERTKEIGIMKAVGARNKDIRSIFLMEASLIGLFGGIIGLILGLLGSQAIQAIVNNYLINQSASGSGDSLTFYVPAYLSIGVVAFAIFVAAFAGYFPARRAAKLDPAEALRED